MKSIGVRLASHVTVRRLVVVVGVVVLLGITATAAWAAPAAPGGIDTVRRFASRLANYITAVAASVAVLFVGINGLRYSASSGNPSRQLEAKNGIVSAGIGLAIALSANVVVQLVVAALK